MNTNSQITKTTYIRALHRAVTLDHGLVRAYHADLDRHRRRGGYEGKPQVTHRAFGAGVAETPPPTSAPCTAMLFEERRSSQTTTATSTGMALEESPVDPRRGAGFTSAGGGGGGVDGGSKGSGGGATGDEVRTRETEPKHGLLRQVTPSSSMVVFCALCFVLYLFFSHKYCPHERVPFLLVARLLPFAPPPPPPQPSLLSVRPPLLATQDRYAGVNGYVLLSSPRIS